MLAVFARDIIHMFRRNASESLLGAHVRVIAVNRKCMLADSRRELFAANAIRARPGVVAEVLHLAGREEIRRRGR